MSACLPIMNVYLRRHVAVRSQRAVGRTVGEYLFYGVLIKTGRCWTVIEYARSSCEHRPRTTHRLQSKVYAVLFSRSRRLTLSFSFRSKLPVNKEAVILSRTLVEPQLQRQSPPIGRARQSAIFAHPSTKREFSYRFLPTL